MGFKTGLWGLDVKYRFRDSISRTWFWVPDFRDWILESGNRDLFSLHISTFTFCFHLALPFFFRDRVFGDRILGTRFRGPDFGDRISGTGFWNQEAKSNQFFLNLELCSVYIFLLISTSTFCLHLTLPSFFRGWVSGTGFRELDFGIRELIFVQSTYLDFYFLSSLDITFLFQGPGFWGPDFGDQVSGTRFRGPDFGDRILESGSQVKPILLESGALFSLHISTYLYFYFLSLLDITFLFSGLGFRDRVSGTGFWNQGIEIGSVYISGLLLSVFTWHYLSFSGTGFLGTGFWGPGFGDQVSGTGFRGPDFGDRILESGSQVKPILLEFWALFSLHISTYLYFYFLSSLDITFLFSGLGFRDRVSGTGFWNQGIEICSCYISGLLLSVFTWHYLPLFGDRVSGTGFRGPNFGDRILGTGFRGPDFVDWISGTGFQKQEAKSNQFFIILSFVDGVLVMMDGWFLFMAVDLDQWFFVMDYPLMNGQCKASSLETCMDLKMHPPAAFPLVSHSGIHFTFQRRICKKKNRPWRAVANWLIWKQWFLTFPDSWLDPTSKIYSFWATFFIAFIAEKKSPYVALKNFGGKGEKPPALSSQLPGDATRGQNGRGHVRPVHWHGKSS